MQSPGESWRSSRLSGWPFPSSYEGALQDELSGSNPGSTGCHQPHGWWDPVLPGFADFPTLSAAGTRSFRACIVSKRASQKAGCLYPSGYMRAPCKLNLRVQIPERQGGNGRRSLLDAPVQILEGTGAVSQQGRLRVLFPSGVCRFSNRTIGRHLEMGALPVEPEGRLMCQSRLVLPGFAYFQRGAPQKAGCLYPSAMRRWRARGLGGRRWALEADHAAPKA